MTTVYLILETNATIFLTSYAGFTEIQIQRKWFMRKFTIIAREPFYHPEISLKLAGEPFYYQEMSQFLIFREFAPQAFGELGNDFR